MQTPTRQKHSTSRQTPCLTSGYTPPAVFHLPLRSCTSLCRHHEGRACSLALGPRGPCLRGMDATDGENWKHHVWARGVRIDDGLHTARNAPWLASRVHCTPDARRRLLFPSRPRPLQLGCRGRTQHQRLCRFERCVCKPGQPPGSLGLHTALQVRLSDGLWPGCHVCPSAHRVGVCSAQHHAGPLIRRCTRTAVPSLWFAWVQFDIAFMRPTDIYRSAYRGLPQPEHLRHGQRHLLSPRLVGQRL